MEVCKRIRSYFVCLLSNAVGQVEAACRNAGSARYNDGRRLSFLVNLCYSLKLQPRQFNAELALVTNAHLQVCCCFPSSVATTRFLIQDQLHVVTTKCDNLIIVSATAFLTNVIMPRWSQTH